MTHTLILCLTLLAPPTDVEVFNRVREIQMKYAELEESDFRAAKQQFRDMIGETARGLNLADMTPYQAVLIGPLLDSGTLDEEQEHALTEALERAASTHRSPMVTLSVIPTSSATTTWFPIVVEPAILAYATSSV